MEQTIETDNKDVVYKVNQEIIRFPPDPLDWPDRTIIRPYLMVGSYEIEI